MRLLLAAALAATCSPAVAFGDDEDFPAVSPSAERLTSGDVAAWRARYGLTEPAGRQDGGKPGTIAGGGDNDSCEYARDGECDEPSYGTGACQAGTDLTDCGDLSHLRGRDDSCATAFNNVCEEPGSGPGTCAAMTDRSDCVGRERPLNMYDHYFGNDDRFVFPTNEFPWSVIGELRMASGGACTAALIAPDVLATASHCIHDGPHADARGTFSTGAMLPGGPRTADVVDYVIDPNWDTDLFNGTTAIEGADWALLRIDEPLGAELGFLTVRPLVDAVGRVRALETPIYQAGYSQDTGDNLSGNRGCRLTEIYDDGTMAHNCDTTRGDSGSPFMWRQGEQWHVMGVESQYRDNPAGPEAYDYIAVRAESFFDFVAPFLNGETGNGSPISADIVFPLKPGMAAYDEAGGAAAGGFDGDPATPKVTP